MTKKLLTMTLLLLLPSLAIADPGTASVQNVPYVRPGADFVYPPDTYEAEGHRCVDLMANVNAGEQVTTVGVMAYFKCDLNPIIPSTPPTGNPDIPADWPDVCCGTFWDHPNGGDGPPNPANFSFVGLTAYDSFWTCGEDWPNPELGGTDTTFAPGSPVQNSCVKYAEWYANIADPNVDGGDWTMARYNFTVDCSVCEPGTCVDYDTGYAPNCWFVIEGDYYYARTGGHPYPFSVEIPVCWNIIPEPASLGLLALGALALLRRR